MSSASAFDVVIIGAGPAGVAAALPLLAAGRRVLILERGPLESAKLPETLLGGGSGDGVLADIVDRATIESAIPFDAGFIAADGTSRLRLEYSTADPAGRFVRIDRVKFDRLLREAAHDRGATLRFNVSATEVSFGDDPAAPANVVHGDAGGSRSTATRLVIDASGKACFLRGALDLEAPGRVLDNRAGWFSHFAVDDGCRSLLPATVNVIPFEDGFVYAIWINPTRMSVGVTAFAPTEEPGEVQFERGLSRIGWLAAQLREARRLLPVIPVQNREFQVQRVATPHYLVAGDAGGFRDPFYCNGIRTALDTGERAAAAAIAMLDGSVPDRERIAAAYRGQYSQSLAAGEAQMSDALSSLFAPLGSRHLTDPHVPYPISALLVKLSAQTNGGVASQMGALRRAVSGRQ